MRRRDSDGQHGLLIALVLLGACVSESSVGTSGHSPAPTNLPPAQSGSSAQVMPPGSVAPPAGAIAATAGTAATPALPVPSLVAITGEPFGRLGHSNALVGDVDGDGLQDFVLAGTSPAPSAVQLPAPAVYVFHGRRTFPANLSATQADAILRAASPTSSAQLFAADDDVLQVLGDINGDGLSDFAVLGLSWFQVVLGNTVPLRGSAPLGAATAGALVVAELSGQHSIYGIGDVNNDGVSDLLAVDASATTTGSNSVLRAYVITGHRDPWSAEALRPPPTLVSVPFAASAQALSARSAGDMDGDGYADMLITVASAGTSSELLFYGGAGKLAGTLTAAQADAKLPAGVLPLADLDGDGRSELAWSEGATVHLRYGTSERLFAEAALIADLSLHAEPSAAGSALRLAVGDIDGDGTNDLLAADPSEARNGAYSGTVYALHGSLPRRTGTLELTAMQVLLSGHGNEPAALGQPALDADHLGDSLCSGADVSADRIDDLLVGAPTRNEADEAPGRVFLIRGLPNPPD